MSAPAFVRAARVRRSSGVQGELIVEPLGGDAQRFHAGLRLWPEGASDALTVAAARAGKDGTVIIAVREVSDRDAADALRGAYLCVAAADARDLGPDEWFVWQLVGATAVDEDGKELGSVIDLEERAPHDLLVVESAAGVQRYPFVHAFIRRVDVERRQIIVAPWAFENEDI